MKPTEVDGLELADANQIARKYVCSTCWGNLGVFFSDNGLYKVVCLHDGCSYLGLVTRKYAEDQRTKSRIDLIEAKENLGKIMGIESENKDKTVEEMLKGLGY